MLVCFHWRSTSLHSQDPEHHYSVCSGHCGNVRAAKINQLIILTYCLKILIFYHTKILRYPKTIIIIIYYDKIKKVNDCYINLQLLIHHHYTIIIIIIYTSTKENSKNQTVSEAIAFLQREIISEVGLRCSVRMRKV